MLLSANRRDDTFQTRSHPDTHQHPKSQEGQYGMLRAHQTGPHHSDVPGERSPDHQTLVRGDEGGRVWLQVVGGCRCWTRERTCGD